MEQKSEEKFLKFTGGAIMKNSTFIWILVILFALIVINFAPTPPPTVTSELHTTKKGNLILSNDFTSDNQFTSNLAKKIVTTNYTAHDPINIFSNSDFYSYASQEQWPGDGTPTNPFVIENLDITGDVPYNGIVTIKNTDVHFIIRNCLIHDNYASDGAGIILQNVSNAVISNVKVFNTTSTGIMIFDYNLAYSHDIVIEDSQIYDNAAAFSTWNTYNITLRNCLFYNSKSADILVLHENANNNLIENNTLYNTPYVALYLYNNSNNIIQNNTIYYSGIDLDIGCNNNTIQYNAILYSGGGGIGVWGNNNVIRYNTVVKAADYALILHQESENNYIYRNNFIRNIENPRFGMNHQAADFGINNVIDMNYWDDWTFPDDNHDGIVDLPYLLDDNNEQKDQHPQTYPFENPIPQHFLIEPEIIYPNGGETLTGNVTIQWKPAFDSYYHLINYTLYYSTDFGFSWQILTTVTNQTTWTWNTQNYPNDDAYMLRITAKKPRGLSTTDNSERTFSISNNNASTSEPMSTEPTSNSNQTTFQTSPPPLVVNTPGWTPIITTMSLLVLIFIIKPRKRLKKRQSSKLKKKYFPFLLFYLNV